MDEEPPRASGGTSACDGGIRVSLSVAVIAEIATSSPTEPPSGCSPVYGPLGLPWMMFKFTRHRKDAIMEDIPDLQCSQNVQVHAALYK
jgi:hypothetical protein